MLPPEKDEKRDEATHDPDASQDSESSARDREEQVDADGDGQRANEDETSAPDEEAGIEPAEPLDAGAEGDNATAREAYDPYSSEDRTEAEALETPKQSEPVTERNTPAPPPPAAPQRSGGGFFSSLIAAIIGGLIGAGGLWYYLQQREAPGPDPEMVAALDRQDSEVAEQAQRLAAIESDIGSLNEALSASDVSDAIEQLRIDAEGRFSGLTETLGALNQRLDSVEEGLGSVQTRLDQSDERLVDLEARPIADPETATEVLRSEVADMRQEVEQAAEAARAQVETMRNDLAAAAEATQAEVAEAERRAAELQAEAERRAAELEAQAAERARAAEAMAALAQIEAALDTGEPYGAELSELSDAADDVPMALAVAADTGVPTIGELRESFPDAARDALRATAVATTEGDPANRLIAFLQTQTQARSLSPQEGDSPNAILSRAEAALDEGDVAAALAEVGALPEDGRTAMQGWIEDAQLRAEAIEAAQTLSQGMN